MERSEGEKWREGGKKKKGVVTARCFSALLGNVSPCKSTGAGGERARGGRLGDFFKGCEPTAGHGRQPASESVGGRADIPEEHLGAGLSGGTVA